MWVLLVVTACSDAEMFGPQPTIDGPLTLDGPVWTTQITTAPGVPPAVVSDLSAAWTSAGPASGTLAEGAAFGKARYRLCFVPDARDDLLSPLGDNPPRDQLSRITECGRPDYCAWMHTVLDSRPDSSLWWGLRYCRDERTRDRVANQAPDALFVQYWWANTLPFHLRLVRIVESAFGGEGDPGVALTAIDVLAESDHPGAEEALLALFAAAPAGWKDALALSLWGRLSDLALAVHGEVCSRIENRNCGRTRPDRLDPVTWMRIGVDPEELFERFPSERPALLERVAECAWSAQEQRDRRACARMLAHVAPDRIPTTADADLEVAHRPHSLQRELSELGVSVPEDAMTALDALDAAGLTLTIDDRPADPVALLYEIADRVGWGDDFDFAWRDRPLFEDDLKVRSPVLTFFAWSDGVRYRGVSGATDSAVVGAIAFANGVLAERKMSVRAALDLDERRIVLAAPATLRALAEKDLVWFFARETFTEDDYGYDTL